MRSYIISVNKISKFSNEEFNAYSLSARDYRQLLINNTNTIRLISLLEYKPKVGKEIGSDAYMSNSKHRFLKTVNISSNFLLEESSIEYCKPENKVFPKKNEILIAKDGGGRGLGETAIYPYENKSNFDSLSAGIIAIQIKETKRNYVFGFLKSQHFKDFIDLNTAQGSTIRHSKLIALEYAVPFPTTINHQYPEQIEQLVSLIVQNIVDKEQQIKLKNTQIDELIEKELTDNQKDEEFSYSYPRISEIKTETRLDTGLYEKEFKKIDFLIKNYNGGYFQIPLDKFKSGSTPKIRIFDPKNKNYNWVTPTLITDEGNYQPLTTINMDTKNNLSKDCILIINRTSKGKKGEYVGITCFYEIGVFGLGQHNQGLYQIRDYSRLEKIFISCLLNSKLYRKICGCVTIGSKMKEMKVSDFASLKFPNFPEFKQQEIANLYYNLLDRNTGLDLANYLEQEKSRNSKVGIFQLNMEIFALREKLEELVHKIVMEEAIDIENYL